MKSLLTDLQSFGSINYYMSLVDYDVLLFEQYQHYVKGTYTNRYYVAGPNGKLLLSIPLLRSGRDRTPIKDLRISYHEPWQTLHWRTLISAYRRSPWFSFYEDELKVMYDKKTNFILDWNLQVFELIQRWLGKKWHVKMTSSYTKEIEDALVIDERHRFLPSKKVSGFSKNLIYYPQVFSDRNGFMGGLSILDLLFCEGNNALKILEDH